MSLGLIHAHSRIYEYLKLQLEMRQSFLFVFSSVVRIMHTGGACIDSAVVAAANNKYTCFQYCVEL